MALRSSSGSPKRRSALMAVQSLPQWAPKRYLTIKQPIGVVAAIAPWNFPIAMITRKVAPALASGCTIVVKPAAETPLCALAIAKLALDAGVPRGVLNIVTTTDASAVGKLFCGDPRVRKLSFTGSTEVGKLLYRQCADTVKKLTLELGGNAPLCSVRRCRSRSGGCWRHGFQIPQRWPDLCLRQPHPCAVRHLRALRDRARGL